MKRIRVILTAPEFISWLASVCPERESDERTDVEIALWAVCLQEAHSVFDMNTKDVASMFLNGFAGYRANPMESIQNWLDTLYGGLQDALQEGDIKLAADNTIGADEAEEHDVPDVVEMINSDFRFQPAE